MKKFNYKIIIFVTFIVAFILGLLVMAVNKDILKFNNEIKISDFITFASVVVAFTAFIISSNQNNENLDIVKKQQDFSAKEWEAKQANEVSCWMERVDIPNNWKGKVHYTVPYAATIQNNSAAPVYSAYVFSVSNKSNDEFDKINAQPNETVYIDVLKPGKSSIKIGTGGSAAGGERPIISMAFKDVNSNYWFRSPHGNLKKISEEELYKTLQVLKISIPISPYVFSSDSNS